MTGPQKSGSVGRYQPVVEVARGPFGPLWVAKGETEEAKFVLIRRVALLKGWEKADVEQLSAAAWWALDVHGSGLQRSLDVVLTDTELGVVSEYLEGDTLRALLRYANFKRKGFGASIALKIAMELARAKAIVRGRAADTEAHYGAATLWPDSILVGVDGQVRLLDLGLGPTWARLSRTPAHELAAYSAPEQLDGTDSEASDVFQMGILLWEMLSGGRRLFAGASYEAVAKRVQSFNIGPVSPIDPKERVSDNVVQLVEHCLVRDPSQRYSSLSELSTALEGLAVEAASDAELGDFVLRLAQTQLSMRARALERAGAEPSTETIPRARAARKSTPPPMVKTELPTRGSSVAPRIPLVAPVDNALPPPPPPPARSSPLGSVTEAEEDSGASSPSSVRASDIMRALATPIAPAVTEESPAARSGAAPPPLPAESAVPTSQAATVSDPAPALAFVAKEQAAVEESSAVTVGFPEPATVQVPSLASPIRLTADGSGLFGARVWVGLAVVGAAAGALIAWLVLGGSDRHEPAAHAATAAPDMLPGPTTKPEASALIVQSPAQVVAAPDAAPIPDDAADAAEEPEPVASEAAENELADPPAELAAAPAKPRAASKPARPRPAVAKQRPEPKKPKAGFIPSGI